MTDDQAPTIYLLRTCPFCFKLRLFLTEAGIADQVSFVVFDAGDNMHQKVRTRMEQAGQAPSFPAAELSPGTLTTETDTLIAWFANRAGVDPLSLPLLEYYSGGLFKQYIQMFRELREIKLAQEGS